MVIKTPPRGWNSWNTFGESVNENIIKETADAMVATGLKDAGYEYVVIDDCWTERERGKDGKITEDKYKFPNGMKTLADYVHSLGLKFGIYSSAAPRTCAFYTGSFDNEFRDAQTFAEWGVDFLKYDRCVFPGSVNGMSRYNRMGMALKATGREMLYSICNCGIENVETWARSVGGNMYRSTGDIGERFSAIAGIAKSQFDLWQYSAPNCYNDMDMLVCGMDGVGNVGHPGLCGDTEYKTHFAIWCMAGSPLMIGSDIRHLRKETVELLTNKDLLDINADAECRPPIVMNVYNGTCPTFFKHLANCRFALAFFNLSDGDGAADFRPWEMGLSKNSGFGFKLREVFTGETFDYVDDYLRFNLKPHDCKVFMGEYVTK